MSDVYSPRDVAYDVGFPTVYRGINCRKFLTLSNQTSRYICKCIRMPNSDPMDNFVYLYLTLIGPRSEKTGLGVSDQARHKQGCTATEDGWRLEISDLGRRGIVPSM